jgi:hypothetical protein
MTVYMKGFLLGGNNVEDLDVVGVTDYCKTISEVCDAMARVDGEITEIQDDDYFIKKWEIYFAASREEVEKNITEF